MLHSEHIFPKLQSSAEAKRLHDNCVRLRRSALRTLYHHQVVRHRYKAETTKEHLSFRWLPIPKRWDFGLIKMKNATLVDTRGEIEVHLKDARTVPSAWIQKWMISSGVTSKSAPTTAVPSPHFTLGGQVESPNLCLADWRKVVTMSLRPVPGKVRGEPI